MMATHIWFPREPPDISELIRMGNKLPILQHLYVLSEFHSFNVLSEYGLEVLCCVREPQEAFLPVIAIFYINI
jgi:hypothetical protein